MAAAAEPTYTGSCKCGALQIAMQGEPAFTALCHCLNCRKTTSSTYSTNAVFARTAVTLVSGAPKVYEAKGGSGNPAYVNFCADCGATMWTASPLAPEMMVVKAGILDGDGLERVVPKVETFTARRPAWVRGVEGTREMSEGFVAPSSSEEESQ